MMLAIPSVLRGRHCMHAGARPPPHGPHTFLLTAVSTCPRLCAGALMLAMCVNDGLVDLDAPVAK